MMQAIVQGVILNSCLHSIYEGGSYENNTYR